MASATELNQYFEYTMEQIARAYHEMNRSGTAAALGREALKDIHNTYSEVFFGKSERGGEPGTPLNPLFHDIIEARKSHGDVHSAGPQAAGPTHNAPSEASGIAEDQVAASPGSERGSVYGQAGGDAQGPEHGVYGPEHGVHGRDSGTQPSVSGVSGPLPTPGRIADAGAQDVSQQDRGSVHGQDAAGRLPTPGEIAAGRDAGGQPGQGIEVAQNTATLPAKPGGYVDAELKSEQGKLDSSADQGDPARGKVLPEDQLENDKGRGR